MKIKDKKWIYIFLLLILISFIISFLVTKIKKCQSEDVIENFNEDHIKYLQHVKVFLYSKYPMRDNIQPPPDDYNNIWQDLSGNNNDFNINKDIDLKKSDNFNIDYSISTNKKINIGQEFTIIIKARVNSINNVSNQDIAGALSLQDRDQNVIEIKLPKTNDYISLAIHQSQNENSIEKNGNKQIIESSGDLFVYSITYKNGNWKGYINSENVITWDKKLENDDYSITINPHSLIDMDIEGLIILAKHLDKSKLKNIDFENFLTLTLDHTKTEKSLSDDKIVNYLIEKSYINEHDDVSQKIDINKQNDDSQSTTDQDNEEIKNEYSNIDCPSAIKSSNDYYIINDINYGKSRKTAEEIYKINYPNCKNIPNILTEKHLKTKKLDRNCPFIVDDMNPCREDSCENVNWNSSNINNSGIQKKCKNKIIKYCKSHNDKDPFCYHWKPENYNSRESIIHRKMFLDINDYGCSPSSFRIEDHPDFNKFIQKDKIPCYGCKL